ncbi:MAG: aminopeptidase, partial [Fervidobacterium sp.]
MSEKTLLKNYAQAILKAGVNLQNEQKLIVNASVDHKDFVRILVEEAYDLGSSEVLVIWNDTYISRQKLLKAPEDVLTNIYDWEVEMHMSFLDQGAATISLVGSYVDLLSDVPPQRLGMATKARQKAFKDVMERTMLNKNRWCVAGVPNQEWARKVYGVDDVQKLLEDILFMARIDENGYEKLLTHLENLKRRKDYLNKMHFDALRYEGPNTDFIVKLAPKHIWLSGIEHDINGIPFLPNIPTEEVFTAPYKYGVNGVVSSSMPLVYQGNIIDEFWLEFKDGKVVNFDAKKGKDILKELIETDEGASYLGEVALVDISSPIYKLGKIFYNTLYDENASSHFAFG